MVWMVVDGRGWSWMIVDGDMRWMREHALRILGHIVFITRRVPAIIWRIIFNITDELPRDAVEIVISIQRHCL